MKDAGQTSCDEVRYSGPMKDAGQTSCDEVLPDAVQVPQPPDVVQVPDVEEPDALFFSNKRNKAC